MENNNFNSGGLIIILICIVVSAYFAATEMAFSSVNKMRLKNMAEKGNKKANKVLKMLDDYDGMLSSILIGNNIVNILGTSLATVLFVNWLGDGLGPSVSTAVTTVVLLIFAEITPKSIAKEFPEKFAMFSAPILSIIMIVLKPFNFLFRQWKKVLSMMFKTNDYQHITEEELLTFVEETVNDGAIDEEDSELIRNVIELSDLTAKDVLTHRVNMTTVDVDITVDELETIFTESGHSRLPVYEDNLDNIIGTIYYKDFYEKVCKNGSTVRDIVKEPKLISNNTNIRSLLKELQVSKNHIAIVIDEFGGVEGMVTIEDLLEELVGDIYDEKDEIEKDIQQISDREYIISGMAEIEVLCEIFDIEDELDEMEAVTVNGWILEQIERMPEEGVSFEYKDYVVEILEMKDRHAEKIKITKK